MAIKFFVFIALVAAVNAGFLGGPATIYRAPLAYHSPLVYHAPIAIAKTQPAKPAVPAPEDAEFDPNPSYSFSYDVSDTETGDTKTQSESLENGVVKGSYSVVGSDGIKRTVEYTADDVNGFNAVVNSEPSNVVIKAPTAKAVAPAPAAAVRVVAAAPAVYHAPLAYHAPVTKVFSAPVTKVVSSPLSYAYHPAPLTYAAAPVHHKVIYG